MTDRTILATRRAAERVSATLAVRGLVVQLRLAGAWVPVVRGIDIDLAPGETLGIVGESGSGKTLSVMAVLGLHPGGVRYRTSGQAWFDGVDLLALDEPALARVRGRRIGTILQDPLAALNPLRRIGDQITEAAQLHLGIGRSQARRRAADLLSYVGIPGAARRLDDHPHQFSGGMRQRALIAMALAAEPELLVADEPTTALDVTIQAQILDLLARLRTDMQMSMIVITHDLGVVAGIADRMAIMYAGRIVELGGTEAVMGAPDHPYTSGLLASIPRIDGPRMARLDSIPGMPPVRMDEIRGCAFAPRCRYAREACYLNEQVIEALAPGHGAACEVHPLAGDPLPMQG